MNKGTLELITNPRFAAVLNKCLEEDELIEQFERIYGVKRPPERLTPVEMMVDKATGFRGDQWKLFFEAFIDFVYQCIWLTWPERDNEECWTCG